MSTVDRSRISVLGIVAMGLFVALVARLASLQVAGEQQALAQVESNRIRIVYEPAPRGQILDARRRPIVTNQEARQLTIDRQALDEAVEFDEDERTEILAELAAVLTANGKPTKVEQLVETITDPAVDPLIPVPIVDDVTQPLAVQLLERHREFPGIDVDRVTLRQYPYGNLAAHVIGYSGPVFQEDLVAAEDEGRELHANDTIGRTGVELQYDEVLRGTAGQRVFEVNAEGQVVRQVTEESFPPTPGMDVQLTIDIDLQYQVELAVYDAIVNESDNIEGAAVILDPRDGAVRAMASYPTFDPIDFVNGVDPEAYAALTGPDSGFPLNNKVVQGNYSPGSTFKPFSAIAGLRNDLITAGETYDDIGYYVVENCENEDNAGCEFQNAERDPKGPVNLASSLTVSSDAYYYRIGDRSWTRRGQIGETPIQDTAREFGFDEPTGIDLPFEDDGIVYTPEIRARVFEENPELYLTGDWRTGDSVIMSIGQGDLQVTPLQLANSYAPLLNDGTLPTPHVADMVLERPARGNMIVREQFDPEPIREIELQPTWRQAIYDGLMGVTQPNLDDATAAAAFEGFPFASWPTGGKTGTVETTGKPDSATYVGFGPAFAGTVPEYVMAVYFPEADLFGGEIAAPVVRRVFEQLASPEGLPTAPSDQIDADIRQDAAAATGGATQGVENG